MKTNILTCVPLLALCALASHMAQAAPIESTLTLSGQIVPVACTLDFQANGVYDYGDISATSFAATGPTALGSIAQSYTIGCASPTQLALRTVDNRSTTVNNPGSSTPTFDFGLGADRGGNNIGYNQYKASNPIIDGTPGRFLVSTNSGLNWTPSSTPVIENSTTSYLTFADAAGTTPIAVTTVTGPLAVEAFVGEKADLDLVNVFNLDGFATMELLYL